MTVKIDDNAETYTLYRCTISWLVFTYDYQSKCLSSSVHGCFNCIRLLYENTDQILAKTLHGSMHYYIDVTCVYNGQGFNTQSNSSISQSQCSSPSLY